MNTEADLGALLMQRLAIVQEIAGLNARQLKCQQEIGGVELEGERCERDVAEGVPGAPARLEALRVQLAQAVARFAAAREELTASEDRLDAVDRQLAGR
ncbi:hypothetical protein FHS55_000551 [Angulomicrobium tetraedrale]|uniref:Uncharacterized protein n=1 Tax=Ancylobacter tetraedralis TaxID=217068 RepID=A0A839Z7D0_9HYPH|nr:hypothetical protein [Ancylobacter tetraedralis]MBB3769965.1 hypothetical protein [Ancylobacter tetraedralis]